MQNGTKYDAVGPLRPVSIAATPTFLDTSRLDTTRSAQAISQAIHHSIDTPAQDREHVLLRTTAKPKACHPLGARRTARF